VVSEPATVVGLGTPVTSPSTSLEFDKGSFRRVVRFGS
jgi:hypothetical protein